MRILLQLIKTSISGRQFIKVKMSLNLPQISSLTNHSHFGMFIVTDKYSY